MLPLIRIGTFYDGNYFQHVTDHFYLTHARKQRVSISGLHKFIEYYIARESGGSQRAQVVDSHYFRGRRADTDQFVNLAYERRFDHALMRSGVVTHYFPLTQINGKDREKGVDVAFALEAYEAALQHRFDVIALVACDADYVPLVRKIAIAGPQVMVIGFNGKSVGRGGKDTEVETHTSQALLDACTYPILLNDLVCGEPEADTTVVDNIFITQSASDSVPQILRRGHITILRDNYGFVEDWEDKSSRFFHHSFLTSGDFKDLAVGTNVGFSPAIDDGKLQAHGVSVLEESPVTP